MYRGCGCCAVVVCVGAIVSTSYRLHCVTCDESAGGWFTSHGSGAHYQLRRWRAVAAALPMIHEYIGKLYAAFPDTEGTPYIGVDTRLGCETLEDGTLEGLADWWHIHGAHDVIVVDEYGNRFPKWREGEAQ